MAVRNDMPRPWNGAQSDKVLKISIEDRIWDTTPTGILFRGEGVVDESASSRGRFVPASWDGVELSAAAVSFTGKVEGGLGFGVDLCSTCLK